MPLKANLNFSFFYKLSFSNKMRFYNDLVFQGVLMYGLSISPCSGTEKRILCQVESSWQNNFRCVTHLKKIQNIQQNSEVVENKISEIFLLLNHWYALWKYKCTRWFYHLNSFLGYDTKINHMMIRSEKSFFPFFNARKLIYFTLWILRNFFINIGIYHA